MTYGAADPDDPPITTARLRALPLASWLHAIEATAVAIGKGDGFLVAEPGVEAEVLADAEKRVELPDSSIPRWESRDDDSGQVRRYRWVSSVMPRARATLC
jgi:hypothetical protein